MKAIWKDKLYWIEDDSPDGLSVNLKGLNDKITTVSYGDDRLIIDPTDDEVSGVEVAGTGKGEVEVFGSHGTLTVDKDSGWVKSYAPEDDEGEAEYADIEFINLAEYEEWLKENELHPLEEGDKIDILYLGYWFCDGTYEQPEAEARSRCKEAA